MPEEDVVTVHVHHFPADLLQPGRYVFFGVIFLLVVMISRANSAGGLADSTQVFLHDHNLHV
jgi:hypothetical protein